MWLPLNNYPLNNYPISFEMFVFDPLCKLLLAPVCKLYSTLVNIYLPEVLLFANQFIYLLHINAISLLSVPQ